ncbi:MAG: transcription antitermination factor NusB [Actinomycetota bacterium]
MTRGESGSAPPRRSQARRLALEILYEADVLGRKPEDVLAGGGAVTAWSPADEFTEDLVLGVARERDALDAAIRRLAHNWTIERMPIIDRNLLRIGAFELFHRPSVPVAVVINEAVELAKLLSTEDSGRFVNGLLGRLAEEVRGGGDPTPGGAGEQTPGGAGEQMPGRAESPEL